MGHQQLLLILLGLIVIAVAIFVGIILFQANAVETKRNNVMDECLNLASMAQQYYSKPTALGGGSKKFTGWRIPTSLLTTDNGNFQAQTFADRVEIEGTGNEVVTAGDSVKVIITVYADSISTRIVN